MQIKTFLIAFVLLSAVYSGDSLRKIELTDTGSVGCIYYLDGGLYDFKQLAQTDDDYTVTMDNGDKVYFDVCSLANAKCPADQTDSFAIRLDSSQGCKRLSGDKADDVDFSLVNKNDTYTGDVKITYNGGDNTTGVPFSLELELTCNKLVETIDFKSQKLEGNVYRVYGESKAACASFSVIEIWEFIEANKYIFSFVFAVLGWFLCLFGRQFLKTTLFLSGFVLTTGVILAVVFGFFINAGTEDWLKWTILGCASLIGIIVGYGLMQDSAQKLGTCVIGALLGYVVGELLYNTVLVRVVTDESYTTMTMVGSIIVCCLVLALIGFYASSCIQIIGTAVFGAFVVFRAAGVLFGGYPTYDELQKEVHNKDFKSVPIEFYLYLGGTVVLSIVGIVFQYKQKRDREHDKEDKNEQKAYLNSFNGDNNNSGNDHNDYYQGMGN